jgi:hypothetical protein
VSGGLNDRPYALRSGKNLRNSGISDPTLKVHAASLAGLIPRPAGGRGERVRRRLGVCVCSSQRSFLAHLAPGAGDRPTFGSAQRSRAYPERFPADLQPPAAPPPWRNVTGSRRSLDRLKNLARIRGAGSCAAAAPAQPCAPRPSPRNEDGRPRPSGRPPVDQTAPRRLNALSQQPESAVCFLQGLQVLVQSCFMDLGTSATQLNGR